MTKNDKLPLIVLAIVLLVAVAHIQTGTFLLYQGVILKNATISNETGECWTLGVHDRCARQEVFMIELESGVLLCPELYFPTEIQCRQNFGLIKEPAKPKLDCYYQKDDVCYLEQFEEKCPSAYFTTREACEISLVDLGYSAKQLLSNRSTLIFIGIGAVALFFIVVNFMRRR